MAFMSTFQMKTPTPDNELLDDWEQMADSGLLDKKLQNIKGKSNEEKRVPDIQPSHYLFHDDGTVKNTPLGPPPQIKILKRPQANSNHGNHNGHLNENSKTLTKAPVKTLQQKEAEYAEARLRILGEAAPAQITEVNLAKLQNRMEALRTEDQSSGGIVRYPRGPDGTRGFHLRN